jgi:hypothetical protein
MKRIARFLIAVVVGAVMFFGLFSFVLPLVHGAITDADSFDFRIGDVNADGSAPNVTDVITLSGYLYNGSPSSLPCYNIADFDGNGSLNVTDLAALTSYVYGGGPHPRSVTTIHINGGSDPWQPGTPNAGLPNPESQYNRCPLGAGDFDD